MIPHVLTDDRGGVRRELGGKRVIESRPNDGFDIGSYDSIISNDNVPTRRAIGPKADAEHVLPGESP